MPDYKRVAHSERQAEAGATGTLPCGGAGAVPGSCGAGGVPEWSGADGGSLTWGCVLYRHKIQLTEMIKSFRHKGVQRFFETGSRAGIQSKHAARLGRMLLALNRANRPEYMDLPGWYLHPLKGADLRGHWSVRVSGNWRLTFAFDGEDAILVDYQDYH